MDPSSPHVETIRSSLDGEVLALIIRKGAGPAGISFITETSDNQQIATLNWPSNHQIESHVHNPMERTISATQEVLFIRSGRVRVDLYRSDLSYQCSRELESGDVVSLVSGGHGFLIIEDSDIVEVKQGPYMGEVEKTRFSPTDNPHWIS